MSSKVVYYVKLSQLSFFWFLAICTVLMPRFLLERNEGGISNFGVHALTVVPFSLAFTVCAACLWQAAHLLATKTPLAKQFRTVLLGFSILLFLTLLSTYPYKINQSFDAIHIWMGIILFYAELGAAVWLTFKIVRNKSSYLLLFVGVIGFALATLTLIGWLHLLFISQMVTAAAFGLLLIKAGQAIATG